MNQGAQLSGSRDFVRGLNGQWATQVMAQTALSGELSPAMLRTCDTLRRDEWENFDEVLVQEGQIRLRAVQDLVSAGLTVPLSNAMGTTEHTYEAISDMSDAYTTMDGLATTPDDAQEFVNRTIPIPITHKDFSINLRHLAASRNRGEALDSSGAAQSARLVFEKLENTLFAGGPKWGANKIEGILSSPYRHTSIANGTAAVADTGNGTFAGAVAAGANGGESTLDITATKWQISDPDSDTGGANGPAMLRSFIKGREILQDDRFYGPYAVYFPAHFVGALDDDYKAESDRTIRERISMLDNITEVRLTDQLRGDNGGTVDKVVMIQLTSDVIQWLDGEVPQIVTWDVAGGMKYHFKVMAIQVPLLKRTFSGRSGVLVFEG